MASSTVAIFLLLATSAGMAVASSREGFSASAVTEAEGRVNPIRRVVSLLQNMQKKITEEGEKELELFDKFQCYCKTSGATLKESVAAAEAKAPEVSSAISETEAKVAQLEEDLKQHKIDRTAAKDTMASAKALRGKQAALFGKVESDLSTNIAALTKAISSISSGMVGAFIQSSSAQALRRLIVDRVDMSDFDRQMVAIFLGEGSHQGYAPQSGQIVGILSEIKDSMTKELTEATTAEDASIKSYEALMAAKKKEIAALTSAIEDKTERLGEAKVEVVQLKQDLSDTEKALLDDKAFLAGLDKNCADESAEHEANMKVRSEEIVALADTIKILNDDDALELFKKTLPGASSASFVQMQVKSRISSSQQQRALQLIQSMHSQEHVKRPGVDFIIMAMKGKKISFAKIIKMIDDMVALLGKEQTDDDHKKATCEDMFDKLEDKMKALDQGIANLEVMIAQEEELVATVEEEIKALEKGIVALDASVADATAQRKEEHAAFEELMTSDQAAKELLAFAKNRLNKFYQPGLYKAPPKRVLSEEDKLYSTFGGVLPDFVQVFAHQHKTLSDVAPPPPPETAAAFKKSADSMGVIYMIDTLIKDLDKEMTEAGTAEKEAQADYEAAMGESAAKRAQDTATMANKESTKAEVSADLLKHTEEKTATSQSLMATSKVTADTHGECDWLLQNFEVRKAARAGEVDSLRQASAVLSGADYSLVQQNTAQRLLRGSR
mmetsp:Transcript_55135/g.101093  ORF Transcript_55135/g.101093 Transcript_55135/m.101093 type:complete len:727 (+) Transcript_55135:55-2235(+)